MATESLSMAPPIAERPGVVGWIRRNLFATPLDIALTLLVLLVLFMVVPPLVEWAIINANWTAVNREQCPADGACWGIVPNRIHQYLFGLYPVDQYWRLILGGMLLVGLCYGGLQNLTLLISFGAVSRRHHNLASAVWNVGFDAGTALGSVAVGVVAGLTSFSTAILCAGALAVATLPLAMRRPRHEA